jgi:hypothetical protein
VSPSFERTFRYRLENRLAEVISDSSNDRNYRVVWFRIEILPTHIAWRPASPSSKGSNPLETHKSGSEQFEDVAGGVDVAVPEVGPASTVSTAQDISVLPQLELTIVVGGKQTRLLQSIVAQRTQLAALVLVHRHHGRSFLEGSSETLDRRAW